jgi:hypothetical protein
VRLSMNEAKRNAASAERDPHTIPSRKVQKVQCTSAEYQARNQPYSHTKVRGRLGQAGHPLYRKTKCCHLETTTAKNGAHAAHAPIGLNPKLNGGQRRFTHPAQGTHNGKREFGLQLDSKSG